MKKRFDFKDVGKRLPYGVPEGFFDDVTCRVADRVARECSEKQSPCEGYMTDLISDMKEEIAGPVVPLRRPLLLRRAISIAVSAACVGVVCYFVFNNPDRAESRIAECKTKAVKECSIEDTYARMSDEDLLDIAAIASAEQMYDLF